MPLYRVSFPGGETAPTSLADAGRYLANPPPSSARRAIGLIEAAAPSMARQFAQAWQAARSGTLDALPRHGLKFRREGRFHVLYRQTGPLFDPADWTVQTPPPRLTAPVAVLSLDQRRAAKEAFIAAHRKDDRSPYETLMAAQAQSLGLEYDEYDAAVWQIGLRDALIAARAFGAVPADTMIVPLAQATISPISQGAAMPIGLSLAHCAD